MKWFNKKDFTIRFKSFIGNFSVATPVVLARELRVKWMREQKDKKFSVCPGMWDYANAGYIVTAPYDIHIKANKAGISVRVDSDMPNLKYFPFDYEVVKGLVPIDDSVKKVAGKIALPWSVQAKKGYSGYCIPALMHSDFFDKIYVYPGIVDYDNFHTINFVFSPIKECEFTIPAGAPLLQVLPFKREAISAECNKASETEIDIHKNNVVSRVGHYYRKFLSRKKTYTMECPYKHRLPVNERPDEDK